MSADVINLYTLKINFEFFQKLEPNITEISNLLYTYMKNKKELNIKRFCYFLKQKRVQKMRAIIEDL